MAYKIRIFSLCLCLSRLLLSLCGSVNVLINILSCVIIVLLSLLITKVKNRIINTLFAICSKLIYSVLIDIFCYCIFSKIRFSYSFFNYILSGLIFNTKSIFINIITMLIILLIYKYTQIKKYVVTKLENSTAQGSLKTLKF